MRTSLSLMVCGENNSAVWASSNRPTYLYFCGVLLYTVNISGYSCCFISALPSALQCDNCGIEPIQGVRWHCQDCPQEMSLDFCDSCSDW